MNRRAMFLGGIAAILGAPFAAAKARLMKGVNTFVTLEEVDRYAARPMLFGEIRNMQPTLECAEQCTCTLNDGDVISIDFCQGREYRVVRVV